MSTIRSIGNAQITPLSDQSVLLSFGNLVDTAINKMVLSLHQSLQRNAFAGFVESVPAYASLAVFYDVQIVRSQTNLPAFGFVKNFLQQLLQQSVQIAEATDPVIRIPVCYADEFAPDINEVGRQHGLTASEVIELHTSLTYRVYMIGFLPGFPYMGMVDAKLVTPRKDQPRLQVPAGSVGIAGEQTGIYPIDAPGGWQIIGKTPVSLFDPNKPSPCLLAAGNQVKFFAIDKNEFERSYVR